MANGEMDLPTPPNGGDATMPGKDWSNRDVTLLLWGDVHRRFDSIDKGVATLQAELQQTASKVDVAEIHQRIDKVVSRIEPLEEEQKAMAAIEENRKRARSAFAWAVGLVASLAIIGSFIFVLIPHH